MPAAGITISMRYGTHRWNDVPFDYAAQILESHVKAERDGCAWHVKKLNEDQWIASFWSEVLGGATAPTFAEWARPLSSLESARMSHRAGQTEMAKTSFRRGVQEFNEVHRKWVAYRDQLELGSERAIDGMEVTIATLSAAAGGALGGSLRAGAAVSASFKAVEESSKAVGMFFYGLDDKVDIAKIAMSVGEELVKSLVTGKLAEKFLGVILKRMTATFAIEPEIAMAMARRSHKMLTDFYSEAGYDLVKESVGGAVQKARGRNVSIREFMELVAEEVVHKLNSSDNMKSLWLNFARNYATK